MRKLASYFFGWWLIFLVALLFTTPSAAAIFKNDFPKRANYYLAWTVSDQEADELAKWDLLVLDMEVQSRSPGALARIRAQHPGIIILAYVTSQDVRKDIADHADDGRMAQISPMRFSLAAQAPSNWYLKRPDGNRISWWSTTYLLNVTDQAPVMNGERWNTLLPRFVNERILSTGLWDGVMYDNSWDGITSFVGNDVDANLDGGRDNAAVLNAAWKAGMQKIYRVTRQLAAASGKSPIILFGNGSSNFTDLNGVLYENFPRYGWSGTLRAAENGLTRSTAPSAYLINANTNNVPNPLDFRALRYGLTSALMGNGYFSFDDGDAHHDSRWWYDEYNTVLGRARATATQVGTGRTGFWSDGLWRREFDRGVVYANASDAPKTVKFNTDFEKIRGNTETTVNDGAVVNSVTIEPRDGIVLLRPIDEVRNVAFLTGAFARILNRYGQAVRNGFYASVAGLAAGTNALIAPRPTGGDLLITTSDNTVRVVDRGSGALISSFAPFGTTYHGGLTIAAGDIDADGIIDLAVGSRRGGYAKIINLNGAAKSRLLMPFGSRHQGGVTVAISKAGYLVTAPYSNAQALVKILAPDGTERNSFYAYASNFRGGASVAIGDVNGDGLEEIITGAGNGGGPHVRVWSMDGELRGQFFPYDPNSNKGVWVGASDTNGDGASEIIALQLPVIP
ncbi:MAG: hypothetical protein HW383_600 [Candidatus Magasanikbacteria bacterium]|nr:hypothetical protein [Candidatus Magasanikbacteria bacterium]